MKANEKVGKFRKVWETRKDDAREGYSLFGNAILRKMQSRELNAKNTTCT